MRQARRKWTPGTDDVEGTKNPTEVAMEEPSGRDIAGQVRNTLKGKELHERMAAALECAAGSATKHLRAEPARVNGVEGTLNR